MRGGSGVAGLTVATAADDDDDDEEDDDDEVATAAFAGEEASCMATSPSPSTNFRHRFVSVLSGSASSTPSFLSSASSSASLSPASRTRLFPVASPAFLYHFARRNLSLM